MPSKTKRNTPAPAQESAVRPCDNDIRCRAYEIYVSRGEHPGSEIDDWLQAEQELGGSRPSLLSLNEH